MVVHYSDERRLKTWLVRAKTLHDKAQGLFCDTVVRAEGDDGLTDASDGLVEAASNLCETLERRLGIHKITGASQ